MIALASSVRIFASSARLGLLFSNAGSRAAFIIAAAAGSKTLDSKRSGMAKSIFHERRRSFELDSLALGFGWPAYRKESRHQRLDRLDFALNESNVLRDGASRRGAGPNASC
jgi:hypothetical protein